MNRTIAFGLVTLLSAVTLAGCTTGPFQPGVPGPIGDLAEVVGLESVASGFHRPVHILWSPDGRALVVEQSGAIRAAPPSGPGTQGDWSVALDLRSVVGTCGNEQGLLGAAFAPGGDLWVVYTAVPCNVKVDGSVGDLVVASAPWVDARADWGERNERLRLPQPFRNHNGGHIAFGPDGAAYVGVGDGGGAGDPDDNGLDPSTPYGTILRIDPETAPGPAWQDQAAVWAHGLRNPWRFAFDPANGDLWVADVGQGCYEELNRVPPGAQGGTGPASPNLGWNSYEGDHPYPPRGGCGRGEPRTGNTLDGSVVWPEVVYPHDGTGYSHCSVTGGPVYRGDAVTALSGAVLYADYCSGVLWAYRDGIVTPLLETGLNPSSFGVDPAGEVYIVHHGGWVYKIVSA